MNYHVLLIFFILSFAVIVGEGASPPYVPTDVFLFNCGDSSDNNDEMGRKWTVENRTILSSNPDKASFTSIPSFQDSGVTQVPYMTARIFRSSFTYSFPVTPGSKFIRLYFYPTNTYRPEFDAFNSLFSVTVNGFTLLKNFSADLTVKGSKSNQVYLIKEFIVPVNQTLNLTFTPSPNSLGFVNGIEINSMPDRFYTKGGFDDNIKSVNGGNSEVDTIDNTKTALEAISRVNVGGDFVNEVGDSGMFRRWLDEKGFLLYTYSGNIPIIPSDIKINYTKETPAYVAPNSVYASCRIMGNLSLSVNFKLSWLFTVDADFLYLVRLHFCEINPEIDRNDQRVFSIFIENQLAMPDVDVFRFSGGSRIPIYLDFSVYVTNSSIQVDLQPNTLDARFKEAILNGVEILKVSDFDGNLAGPNPNPSVSKDPTQNNVKQRSGNGNKSHILPIILAVIGSAIVLAIVVVVVVLMTRKKKKSNESSVHTISKPITDSSWGPLLQGTSASTNTRSATSLPSDLCRRFTIFELKTATNNFDDNLIVGKGGFGTVYKGRIDGGATMVAVKRLDITSSQGAKEFETELEMLSMLRHLHLVSLIGYCDDEYEMVLVYEYMPHGTLRDHLYKRDKASVPPLSWKRRLEICIGAARGIQYLHTGTKHTIIHRDIKTTNILLDENFVAKVADFGLSKVGPTSASQTHVSTVVKGTSGYLDPEYYRRQVLTDKSDVYSFGVVLFEVMCCRPTLKILNGHPEQADLVRWVKLNHKRGTIDQIIDTDLVADITSISLEKFCEIAVRCVQDRGIERPCMNDVVWALEFALQLHESAQKKNENVDSQALMPREDIGTATDGDDNLFSRTTELVPISTTTDESAHRVGDEESGSSWGVFSEIKDPKAR